MEPALHAHSSVGLIHPKVFGLYSKSRHHGVSLLLGEGGSRSKNRQIVHYDSLVGVCRPVAVAVAVAVTVAVAVALTLALAVTVTVSCGGGGDAGGVDVDGDVGGGGCNSS